MIVGLTMRMLLQDSVNDMHDALSHDWGRFFTAVGLQWIPLPNRGEETVLMVQQFHLSGIILSGGGIVGEEPQRDYTETLLLNWATTKGCPVLGICRGFQMIQTWLGGMLVPLQNHVATYHTLLVPEDTPQGFCNHSVNSFHTMGIADPAPGLTPIAFSNNDGHKHVEAAVGHNLLGLMWHPEREVLPHNNDVTLVQNFFYNNQL